MQNGRINTAFENDSSVESSDPDSESLDDLVNPMSISVLIKDLDRQEQYHPSSGFSNITYGIIPSAPGEKTLADETIPPSCESACDNDQISQLKNDLEAQENLNSELAKENDHLKQKIANLEQQLLAQNKIEGDRKNEVMTEIHRKLIQALEEKNARTELDLKVDKEKYKSSENERNKLESKYQRLEVESNRLKRDLKASNDENQNLQRQIECLQEQQAPSSNSCCNIS